MDLILASSSATRRRILDDAGVTFRAIWPDIDEDAAKAELLAQGTRLEDMALGLAAQKALAVARRYPDAMVLGADQTLLFDGALISKCGDLEAARALLLLLKGRTHRLVGGLVLVGNEEIVWRHRAESALTVRPFSDAFLDGYLAREGEAILASVGCYRLEGMGAQLFEAVEGDYFSILGLPLLPLLAALRKQGLLAS